MVHKSVFSALSRCSGSRLLKPHWRQDGYSEVLQNSRQVTPQSWREEPAICKWVTAHVHGDETVHAGKQQGRPMCNFSPFKDEALGVTFYPFRKLEEEKLMAALVRRRGLPEFRGIPLLLIALLLPGSALNSGNPHRRVTLFIHLHRFSNFR